jgi:tRNA (mo5U34)-methyltransferase
VAARQDVRAAVASNPIWYHTLDLGDGVVTPGWFDLRDLPPQLPIPASTSGLRCLDIGTFDGFFAFEMERRGAAEVVAIDIEDHLLWDWPPDYRGPELTRDIGFTGPPKGDGFRLIRDLVGSKVDWRPLSIYDLDPTEIGTFDVVVMGTLLLHLRDPIRALEAVRTVTDGVFLSSEQIELWPTVFGRGRPWFSLNGSGGDCQWFNYNAAGHYRMVFAAGFEIEQASKPYVVRFNEHPKPPLNVKNRLRQAATLAMTGTADPGILHRAVLARPRV